MHQTQNLSLQQVLAPQLQQSLLILQAPLLELRNLVQQEMETNPVLEELPDAPNPDAPGVSDASLGETWYLGLLAGGLLWVGLFPGGPKLPGTDSPLFDQGLVNVMAAGISDIASPYVLATPGTGR